MVGDNPAAFAASSRLSPAFDIFLNFPPTFVITFLFAALLANQPVVPSLVVTLEPFEPLLSHPIPFLANPSAIYITPNFAYKIG